MAYTVWGAFDYFRKNVVDLESEETRKARASRDFLFEQLKRLANTYDQFPLVTSKFHPFGSFARRTKICPLNDIDVMFLFNGTGTTVQASSTTPYTYWLRINSSSAPLAAFPDDHGFVNSTKLLNRTKSLLSQVQSYRKADLKKTMQAVVLDLYSYTWVFDIVPAIGVEGNGETAHYLIPDGKGDWIRTDPRIDAKTITDVSTRHNGQFLPVMRLLKYWNHRTHKPRLASYYFETLVIKVFQYASPITEIPQAIKYFFDQCPLYLRSSCPDPKGLGPNLDANVDWQTKDKVIQAMNTASTSAGYALMYSGMSNEKDAIYWWGQVFGSEFPSYG